MHSCATRSGRQATLNHLNENKCKLIYFYSFISINQSLDDIVLFKNIDLQYSEPCAGCSKCYLTFERPEAKTTQVEPQSSWAKWLRFGFSARKQPDSAEQIAWKKMKTVRNDNCGQLKQLTASDVLNLRVQNDPNSHPNRLLVRWYSKQKDQTKLDFFSDV
jgi:hypothetical protein